MTDRPFRAIRESIGDVEVFDLPTAGWKRLVVHDDDGRNAMAIDLTGKQAKELAGLLR